MKTLKLSGNMRVIDFDPQTGQSDVDDSRDTRIAELEAALRETADALEAFEQGCDCKGLGGCHQYDAMTIARQTLRPTTNVNSDKETE